MRVVIWGIGEHCKKILSSYCVAMKDIVCFIDSNEEYHNTTFCRKDVIAPDELKLQTFDAVVLSPASKTVRMEIMEQLYCIFENEISVMYIDDFARQYGKTSTKDVLLEKAEYNIERLRLVDILTSIPPIDNKLLENAKLVSTRQDILKYMPQNAIVAEVGVAYGEFTKKILSVMKPQKFYAIDYYSQDNPHRAYMGRNDFQTSNLTHYEWYEKQFKKEIENGQLEMKQGFSWDVLETFPDNFFDYVYLDACHEYDAVKKDVEVLERKVKPNGIIAFNDYNSYCMTIEPTRKNAYFGVPAVVNEFIGRTNSQVLFLSLARHSSYDIVIRLNK